MAMNQLANSSQLLLVHVHSNVFEKHCAELLENPKATQLQRRDKNKPKRECNESRKNRVDLYMVKT